MYSDAAGSEFAAIAAFANIKSPTSTETTLSLKVKVVVLAIVIAELNTKLLESVTVAIVIPGGTPVPVTSIPTAISVLAPVNPKAVELSKAPLLTPVVVVPLNVISPSCETTK